MANLLQYDPYAYGYVDPNAAPPPPPEDPNLLYTNPLSTAPAPIDKYSAPGYMPVNGEGGYTSQGDYAPAPVPAGPPPDQGYQAQIAGSGAPASYGSSVPPPDQGYQAQIAGSGGYQEPVPPPAPLTFDQGPDARADVNVIRQPQSTMGAGSAPAGGTFAPQPTAPLPMINDRSSVLGQNTRPFPASADQSYGQVERNRAGIDYPQSAPSLMTHTKPPQKGGYSVSGRSGYKAPQPNTPQLPPQDPFQILQGAANAVGGGAYDAVNGALNAITPGADAKALPTRAKAIGGGGALATGSGVAGAVMGQGKPIVDPFTLLEGNRAQISAMHPSEPPTMARDLYDQVNDQTNVQLQADAMKRENPPRPAQGVKSPPVDPYSLLTGASEARSLASKPNDPVAQDLLDQANAYGQQQAAAEARKRSAPLQPAANGIGSAASGFGGMLSDWVKTESQRQSFVPGSTYVPPGSRGLGKPKPSTTSSTPTAPKRPSAILDPSAYKSQDVTTPLEAGLAKMKADGVLDEKGNWTPQQEKDNAPYVTDGKWNQNAVDKGLIAPDALGKPADPMHLLSLQKGTPLESGSPASTGEPPVTNGPVTNSDTASNTSTDGGSDWVDYGSGKKSSGWVDYGSSKKSSGWRDYGSGGGGGSGRSFGGSSGGVSSRWQDYAEDSDGDGQFSPAEMKAAKKKMKMAMMKRGKMGKGKKGSMIQRPTSPIRKTTLANLSKAFGRPVGGWPEGL